VPAATTAEAVRAARRFERDTPVDALLYRADFAAPAGEARKLFLEMAFTRAIPLAAPELWVEKGALFGFGFDWRSVGAQAARLARRALARSGEILPAEPAEETELVVNARTARKLGLEVPPGADVVYDGSGER
jgi:ABC-type uncharacterized transport system substrate-binding protein